MLKKDVRIKYFLLYPILFYFITDYVQLSLWFVGAAAIMNACMDKVTHHFHKSVFSKLRRSFFDPSESWKNKYRVVNGILDLDKPKWWLPDALKDFWHICKTVMILLIATAIVTHNYMGWFDFVMVGIYWNFFFSLFYDVVLKKEG